MKNIDLLFASQEQGRVSSKLLTKDKRKKFQFNNKADDLDGELIKKIIDFYNLVKTKRVKLPIVLELGDIRVADKLSYIVLECLVLNILKMGYSVTVNFKPNMAIDTDGIDMSPLMNLNQMCVNFSKDKKNRETKFEQEFRSKYFGAKKFRRLIIPKDESYLSKLTSDLILFLKNQYELRGGSREKEYDQVMVIQLANTIGELVGNAIEHGDGECLLDIDITHNFTHQKIPNKKFGAVNIAVVNFSKKRFGDKVKDKILSTDLSKNQRYGQIKQAYDIHRIKFDDIYYEEHFWNLASIQDKISGRLHNYNNGGKGCTELIKSIQHFTHEDYCYMMSGKEILNFKKEFLNKDKHGFLSFNDSDFFVSIPNGNTFGKSKVYLPGVAYNLNFIL